MSGKPMNPVQNMLQILMGTVDVTKDKATEAATMLLSMPGAGSAAQVAGQVSGLADEMLRMAAANRRLVHDMVVAELEGSLTRLGLATQAELLAASAQAERLTAEVKRLRNALDVAGVDLPGDLTTAEYDIAGYEVPSADGGSSATPAPQTRPAGRSNASRAAVKATAKKATAKKATAKKATAKKATAKKATAKKATAKKATGDAR